MTREQLIVRVNLRRMMRGKEPLMAAHIGRAMRFLFGPTPMPTWEVCRKQVAYRVTAAGLTPLEAYERTEGGERGQ